MLRFHALGGVAVTADGHELNLGGPRQRRLLAVLLLHRGAVVSMDRLVDAVFAGEPTPAAAATMRSYVARIRRVVEVEGSDASVLTRPPGYLLRIPDEAFDVTRFERSLADGRSLLSRGDPAGAAAVLREALAQWRGDAYAEFDDEDWARPEAQRLGELRLVAQELRVQAELGAGRAADVLPDLEAMVAQHPLREELVAHLMTALYRCGRQADALRAYQRHRDVLVDELGLDPTPALAKLEERVLAHDPSLLAVRTGGEALRGYQLGDRLGTGPDGAMHVAHVPGVDRDLVILEYRATLADSPAFVRSFEATAQRIAALRNPAIVPIHDYWREPGAAYLVTRRMHGGSLADRLQRPDRPPLSREELAALVRRIGGALVAAAEIGAVHGRVDASAVHLDERGDAWLGDFDLATAADGRSPEVDVHGLAELVRACSPAPTPLLAAAIAAGTAEVGRPSMAELVDRIVDALTGDGGEGSARTTNPYKGLRAFEEADAADFFGRSELLDELVRRLGREDVTGRLVLLVGGSGTGKSSAVRAGLLPRIRSGDVPGSERWFVTSMLPGATPFKELAAALRRVAVVDADDVVDALAGGGGLDAVVRELLPDHGQLLLVIDQFEELFTSAPEPVQRRFLDRLVHAVSSPDARVRIVCTLRADFYDRPLAIQPFASTVSDCTVTIPAMSATELEAAITGPAERVGRAVDRGLVAELVGAALDEPASLPSLQFTLYELAARTDGDLTLGAYRELGGLSGAIASRAEALYRSLEDDERGAVRSLFDQLLVVNEDGEPTRWRATRTELTAADAAVDAQIDRWAEARLLSLDRHRQSRLPTVEIAHEALLREWPRLRRWIDEDREALIVLGHLRAATTSWNQVGRDPGALYRGARLQLAVDTLRPVTLAPDERAFLDASTEARAEEERQAAAHVQRQAAANRRLRRQLVVIGVALVVALAGGIVAVDQQGEAEGERRVARARELAAAAEATLEEDAERSTLLALEAIEVARDGGDAALPEAVGALHRAISRSRILLTIPGVGGAADWSPEGSLIVTEGPESSGLIDLRDAETGESVRSWKGHDVDVNAVAFSADGEMLATGGDDGYLRVWATDTGEQLAQFRHRNATSVGAPAFSPDGRLVTGHWTDVDSTKVFDLGTGELVAEVPWSGVPASSFSPDGRRIALASLANTGVLVVDATTGAQLARLGGPTTPETWDAEFSPDGRWLASAHHRGVVWIWDARTGELVTTIARHRSDATALAWSPDSTRLATGSTDGTARVFELLSGGARESVVVSARDTASGIAAVAFSPDGDRLMTSDVGFSSVKIWDISERAGAELADIPSVPFAYGSGQFLDEAGTVVAVDAEGGVASWDAETGERFGRIDVLEARGIQIQIAATPDGTVLATGRESGVRIWDLRTGEQITMVGDHRYGFVTDLAWSADGRHLAIARIPDHEDVTLVTVVDRAGTTLAEHVESTAQYVSSMAFSGDRLVLAASSDQPSPESDGVRVWDWRRDEIELQIRTVVDKVAVDHRDHRVVATQPSSDAAHVFDLETGRRLRTLRGAGVSLGVTFSADGDRVAMSGADGTIRIFDPGSGRLELILRGHDVAVIEAWFSPDGTRLASLAEDGTVRVWELDLDELVEIARTRLTRSLDDAECRQYLRQERCAEH